LLGPVVQCVVVKEVMFVLGLSHSCLASWLSQLEGKVAGAGVIAWMLALSAARLMQGGGGARDSSGVIMIGGSVGVVFVS